MIILHLIIMEVATSWIALVSPTHDVCLPASRVVLEVRNHFLGKRSLVSFCFLVAKGVPEKILRTRVRLTEVRFR